MSVNVTVNINDTDEVDEYYTNVASLDELLRVLKTTYPTMTSFVFTVSI